MTTRKLQTPKTRIHLKGGIAERMMQFAKSYIFCRLHHRIHGVTSENSYGNMKKNYEKELNLFLRVSPSLDDTWELIQEDELTPTNEDFQRFGVELRALLREPKFVKDYLDNKYSLFHSDACFIHIDSKVNGEYIRNAMDVFRSKQKDITFIVVTEDARHILDIPCLDGVPMIEEPESIMRIYLMTRFVHGGILSKDSIESWWGAFLNLHPRRSFGVPSGFPSHLHLPGAFYCIHD